MSACSSCAYEDSVHASVLQLSGRPLQERQGRELDMIAEINVQGLFKSLVCAAIEGHSVSAGLCDSAVVGDLCAGNGWRVDGRRDERWIRQCCHQGRTIGVVRKGHRSRNQQVADPSSDGAGCINHCRSHSLTTSRCGEGQCRGWRCLQR